jgi:hypothetical protein
VGELQHFRLGQWRPEQLQPYRQAISGETDRNRERWKAGL